MHTTDHDGHRAHARPEEARRASAAEGASFTEAIDRRTGRIRASGRLDTRAAGMLSGTVHALRRGGWTRVVVDLGGVQADEAGVRAVHSLERDVAADGGHVALLNWPA